MRSILTIASCLLISFTSLAQEVTRADYARAVSFLWPNLINKKVFNLSIQPAWFPDSTGFSFVTYSASEKLFQQVLFKDMKVVPLFDQEKVARLLTDSLKMPAKASALPIDFARYVNKSNLELSIGGKRYQLNLTSWTLSLKKRDEGNEMQSSSPDKKWIAFSRDQNLFLKAASDGKEKQLSTGGKKNYEYASYYGWGELIEGENADRPPHFGVNWSPDSKWIQTYICDLTKAQKMYLLDWSVDTLYRARLLSYYRGSPGDTDMMYMTPVIFNIETGEEIRLDEFRNVNAASLAWAKAPGILYVENRARGYQQTDLYRYDLNNHKNEKIYSESSTTNIDTYNSMLLEDAGEIIITSERDGWRQLYSLNEREKTLKPLTKGTFYVNDILHTPKKNEPLLFSASGREAGRNPYYQHLYRINRDGSGLTLLTNENANHDISVSPDGKYFTDNISAPDQAPLLVLKDTKTGRVVKELSRANIEGLLSMNYKFPETFTATARDGSTKIYGAIWKPTLFDSTKLYPVIDQSYTGPHTNMFPRSFTSTLSRSNQALAELGFIVITVDGMGTAGRSKAFHNVSYKNMGKNLADHVLAIRELGTKYKWIDTNRVGIFGHSAGGYDAGHAVLEFPDFYKVAVASSGDHDFRMEKDWWPEMYMGWPVDSTYDQVSNITMAGNLKGKLLLVHGGIDENVNPSATFKFAEALIKADKEFDMLIIPSQHHGYTGKFNDYFTKKKWNYFVEHLLGYKPIWNFELK